MRMMQTALLTGPYDWDSTLLPVAEYEARLAAVRHVLAQRGATALLVHGYSAEYGALAYLTGFVPKLGPALALVANDGSVRIFCSGGPGMQSSGKLLTWVGDVRPLGDFKNAIRDSFGNVADVGPTVLGMWGARTMAHRLHLSVAAATQCFANVIELDEPLDSLRCHKSRRERELLRRVSAILAAASETLARAAADGFGARSAALAAERTAFALEAQDVRILASARNAGPPLPFDGPADVNIDPLLACVAVRFAGYWAEGFVTIAISAPSGALGRARAALSAMLHAARAGTTFRELRTIAAGQLRPYAIHPLVQRTIVSSIGLSLEETSGAGDENMCLQQGGVYTLRAGAIGEGEDNALVSAMIAVDGDEIEILWSATNPSSDDRRGGNSR